MDQLIDQVFCDRYHIHTCLDRQKGQRTYHATNLVTNLPVVVQILLFDPDFFGDNLNLFKREAETLKSLSHRAIPKYLDSFEINMGLFKGFAIVQSYSNARSLQEWVQSGRTFSEAELMSMATELLDILDYLHQRPRPVIHRDINPSNVLLGDRSGNSPGHVYLVDFGAVQAVPQDGTVTVVGTYGYMALEQFGGRSSPASDLYGLGATLIYLATRQNPADLLQQDLQVKSEQLAHISPSFRDWLCWLTEIDGSKRPSSAKDALEHIEQPPKTEIPLSSTQQFSPASQLTTKIQLSKTSNSLKINIPSNQINALSLNKNKLNWGCHYYLASLGLFFLIPFFPFLIHFYSFAIYAVFIWILWPFLSYLIQNLIRAKI